MAYYELGLSQEELRERYLRHVEEGMSEADLAARFGKPQLSTARGLPPYRFLVSEQSFEGMPDYNQLRTPSYRDSKGREYTPQGQDPRLVYVRLPKSKTTLEFPERSEMLLLRDSPDSPNQLVVRCHHVVAQRTATALVQLEDPLPASTPKKIQQRREKEQDWIQRYKRKFAIGEHDTELSEEAQKRLAPRPSAPPPPERTRISIARIPTIRKLRTK